ncbi:MAG: hypothetical protein JO067_05525 [Cupriavidus sp.]|nr:hypothetical protein [Cupriavidus sp.]
MNQARYDHTATLLPSGMVLVMGGRVSGTRLASAELYDPTTGTWTQTGSMTQACAEHAAMLLPGDSVRVGGRVSTGALLSAELFNPAMRTWSSTGNLN